MNTSEQEHKTDDYEIEVVMEVKAAGYEVRCPYCKEILEGYYRKPSGEDECDYYGKTFIVSKEADIEEYI